MAKKAEYGTGWIDTTIHDFLLDIRVPPPHMAYALVTCLDSSFDLRAVVAGSAAARSLRGSYRFVGESLLIPTRRLLAAERRKRLFFGFDEVWFFPQTSVRPKPSDLVITGPQRISTDLGAQAVKWMRRNGCTLGLGDGTGMNFCARLEGIAGYLLRASCNSDINGRVSA